MAYSDFKVKHSNYSGAEHDAFKADLLALSFSKPSIYIELRKQVVLSLKTQFAEQIYDTFYHMLTDGRDKDGTDAGVTNIDGIWAKYAGHGAKFAPRVPNQEVTDIASGVAGIFDKKLNEIVDTYLVPMDNLKLAHAQTVTQEAGLRIKE